MNNVAQNDEKSIIGAIKIDKKEVQAIITRMRELGFKLSDNMLRSLLNSQDISPDFHPFIDWIKTLPEWHEGDHDHETDFIGYFVFTDKENSAFYDHFIRRFLRGMVALALGMTDHNPLDLLFEGEENVGKSHMTKNLLPPHLREYQAQAYSFLAKDKEVKPAAWRWNLQKYSRRRTPRVGPMPSSPAVTRAPST